MTLRTELWPIATTQYGFVTTQDVRELGFSAVELAKLASRARLERVSHGLYRFPELPQTERDDYMRAVLATGAPDAILSHDTALLAHDLCDINPEVIHVNVGKHRVRRSITGVQLHSDHISPGERTRWEGIPVVTVFTAIEQGIATKVPRHLLRQAIEAARARGQLTAAELSELETNL
ncbi:putative AbiEi antitoxin of type IV toxin-antitoxin system [Rhodoglobus vestalii]|uniref:Putative AbiEi antitoxin of type IV toxin-antitoxin system n=1 Tax=Rhodoglobus vestalii TaxID=193384 RepID=A0A8H2K6H2_9MICO|nr:type IV toxin-antitoxin system AbiEi family antitoxin domain-containing protein [Rhodoglobus vestalii]TQO19752.1 putative AbiEi antitoxin of type IV toxin-antitoxin system [Rhodoglobus vestalii]